MGVIISYKGEGIDPFCLQQTGKAYASRIDTNQVQIQEHDDQTLWQALTAQGPKRKWLIIPGGNAYDIANYFPKEAAKTIRQIWLDSAKEQQLDVIGHCAGAILLGQGLYNRNLNDNNFYFKAEGEDCNWFNLCPVKSIAPLFKQESLITDNAQVMRVEHCYNSDSSVNACFDSCVWSGPGFVYDKTISEEAEVIRKFSSPFEFQEADRGTTVFKGTFYKEDHLPASILYTNPNGLKACLIGDHIEFNPKDLNDDVFNFLALKFEKIAPKKYRDNKDDLKTFLAGRRVVFRSLQKTLLASNYLRIAAFSDTLARMEIPQIE